MGQYLPIVALLVLVAAFAGISLIAQRILVPPRPNAAKVAPYECGILDTSEPPERFPAATETLLVEPSLRVGRVDTVRLRQKGASLEVRQGLGATSSPVVSTYTQTTAELLAFVVAGERWNFALRARVATISKVPEHLELYVGGLDLLRGYLDNYVRTRGYVLTNLEVRYVAFDSTWVALMPVVFTDAMASEVAPRALFSAGAGVRVLVPKFVGTGLRFDLAVPFRDPTVSPNFGVYQFF
mgnify:CR=1 FL=1